MTVTKEERAPRTRHPRTIVPGGFPARIAARYRIRRTMLGPHRGDAEFTIPIRDGGHAYVYSDKLMGLWIMSSRPAATINALRRRCPALSPEQVGDREFTAAAPWRDAPMLLNRLGAPKRRKLRSKQRERFTAAGQGTRFAQKHGANGCLTRAGSTISDGPGSETFRDEIAA